MRRKIFLSAVLLGGFFVLFFSAGARSAAEAVEETCATSTGWGSVKINEVSSYSGSDDWVEIFNLLEMCVDLNGLKLWDSSASSTMKSLSGSVAGRGFAVADVNNRLNRDSDSVILKNDETELDRFDYGTADYPAAGENEVWARAADGSGVWQITASPTPGATNIIYAPPGVTTTDETPTTTSTTTDSALWNFLRLNEIVSDPAEGNEGVEIFNSSTGSVNLAGVYLCDSRGATSTSDCKDLSGSVDAFGWLWVDWTGYFLNNDTDSVILKNSEDETVDEIIYGVEALNAPEKGQSLARSVDGVGAWQITTVITKGGANSIVTPIVPVAGGGGSGGAESVPSTEKKSSTTTTKTTTTTAKTKTAAEKAVGLLWQVKYDPRVRVGGKTVLDASGSLDPRGGQIDMVWGLGEGIFATGTKIEYAFVSSGLHDILISATTSAGTVDEKKIKITVYSTEIKTGAGVMITQILPNSAGEDKAEFIAIKNVVSTTVNISNWKFLVGDKIYAIPTSTKILPGDTLNFYRAVTGFVLPNTGGAVELRDAQDILIDRLEYGRAKEGQVMGESASSTVAMSTTTPEKKPATVKSSASKAAVKNFYGVVSAADARALPAGGAVKVRGVVSAAPGVFGSQYFYAWDGEAGIQIYQYKKDFPELKAGDRVEVTGEISEAQGVKRIKMKNRAAADILATDADLPAMAVELADLSEDYAGALVRVRGEITEIKSYYMYIDDGEAEAMVYFKKGANMDKTIFKEGETVEVVGVAENSKSGLQIWPRGQADIVSLGITASPTMAADGTDKKEVAEKYLTATAGGVTTLLLGFLVKMRGAVLKGLVKKAGLIVLRVVGRG